MVEYREVPDMPGLIASSDGRLFDCNTMTPIKTYRAHHGHRQFSWDGRTKLVNRVICRTFHGEPPEGKPLALHQNNDPGDNRAENLKWGSYSQNQRDRNRHGTAGTKGLTLDDAEAIRRLYSEASPKRGQIIATQRAIGTKFNICPYMVWMILTNRQHAKPIEVANDNYAVADVAA